MDGSCSKVFLRGSRGSPSVSFIGLSSLCALPFSAACALKRQCLSGLPYPSALTQVCRHTHPRPLQQHSLADIPSHSSSHNPAVHATAHPILYNSTRSCLSASRLTPPGPARSSGSFGATPPPRPCPREPKRTPVSSSPSTASACRRASTPRPSSCATTTGLWKCARFPLFSSALLELAAPKPPAV